MRSKIPALLAMTLLAAGAPCAQTTDAPRPAATPASAAEPGAKLAEAAPAKEAETRAAAKPPKAPPGFKVAKRPDGEYVYCQEFSRLGTRFKEKICLTQEQFEDFERRNQNMRQAMQQPVVCAGGPRNCAAD